MYRENAEKLSVMSSRDFIIWLNGFAFVAGVGRPTLAQWGRRVRHDHHRRAKTGPVEQPAPSSLVILHKVVAQGYAVSLKKRQAGTASG